MSLLVRSSSRVLTVAVTLGLVACIDAPQLSSGAGSTSPDATNGGGGASSVSRERDGMVLVPEVTVDVPGGVAPVNVDPQAKGDKPDKGDKDKPGKGNGNGGGNNGGGNNGGGNNGGGNNGGGNNGGGGTDAGASTPPPPPPAATPPGPTTQHVAVPSFWIDALEVTVEAYRRCLTSGACTAPTTGAGCTLGEGLETHPVTCVSADQARAFCTWSNKRLVRGDEFTAAAAGTAQRIYPWGAEPPAAERVNACGAECAPAGMYSAADGYIRTAPAGSFASGASPDGALDLAGNVAEWVEGGLTPVARGGSYADVDASSLAATHGQVGAAPGPSIGFRCAADR
jgi:hypothetical protein